MAHVLVVDDSAANRDLLDYLFTYFGHRVTQATGGDEAIAAARDDRPDLIVMDLLMPGVDGYHAASAVRRDPALADIPLIAVSAARSATQEAAQAAGFDGFYTMPLDPETFVELLAPYLHAEA
jgi:CheY-like chemotaxis protein